MCNFGKNSLVKLMFSSYLIRSYSFCQMTCLYLIYCSKNVERFGHHGVFIDSGHYVSYIRKSNKWYHCDDKHITETNLLTSSNNVYLMFYAKEVD